MQRRGIGPHLVGRGKSHGFSPLSLGTFGIFSHNGQEGPSKFMFVQQRQDSCLVARDTRDSPWARKRHRESYPGEAETQGPCPLSIGKLGFLSIFKITQISSQFEALNSE